MRERRQFPRFPFNADVEVVEPQSGAKITGRVSDLSLSGCWVDTLSPFLTSTAVRLKITKGRDSFEAQAKVTHLKNGLGMGLAFVAAQPDQQQILGKWIVELGGKLPIGPPHNKTGTLLAPSGDSVLAELILTLVQKGVLSETEAQEMLGKIKR